jgi:diphthamide biosynthesis protein 2
MFIAGTDIYSEVVNAVDDNCDVYIAADSTFGSSVDDISAAHVDSDLLIYFASDMSASGTIPVMVVPQQSAVDSAILMQAVTDSLQQHVGATTLLIYDPSYIQFVKQHVDQLIDMIGAQNIGKLPPCADIASWTPSIRAGTTLENIENVGGLLFSKEVVGGAQHVVYIGEKREQLVSVLLRLSGCDVTAISPVEGCAAVAHKGVQSVEYRERYAGVMRTADAEIIGIIVGSMGLSDVMMNTLVHQVQTLIRAAGKKSYTFVMGRLNEAKLCNFPEVIRHVHAWTSLAVIVWVFPIGDLTSFCLS